MKHSPASLLERAAEVYDFASALRAPPAAPAPLEAVPVEAPRRAPEPALVRAAPPPRGRVAAIDRVRLAEAGFIVPDAPVSGLAEEFRLIKRQLLAEIDAAADAADGKSRSVLVCSARPDEGKTFCALNLALSLAGERDLEVLLIDADFTKPELLATLGVESGPGLVDAIADPDADPESFVVPTDVGGLLLLPAGRKANNVPELLGSERTREVLARLAGAGKRRILLFDSPPTLMASAASVLAGHVGRALMVVRADRTTESDLREAVALLSGCDRIGLILNAAGFAPSGRRYGGYYGDGHDL